MLTIAQMEGFLAYKGWTREIRLKTGLPAWYSPDRKTLETTTEKAYRAAIKAAEPS